jgi:hypothetical protein
MPTSDLDLFVATLVPVPGLRATAGELLFTFDGQEFAYLSYGLILQIDMGSGAWMEASGSFENTGTFGTEDGVLNLVTTNSVSDISSWTAYKDGVQVTVPGSGPVMNFPPPGGSPYRCYPDRLEIDTQNGTGTTITMFFTRQN